MKSKKRKKKIPHFSKKITILGISVIIILLLSVFYFITHPSVDPNTIILKRGGFFPKEMTIQVGQTITFKTSLKKPFWPASNLHPTHTIYSDFDPKKPIDPGQSWSFTFTKAGNWNFHDHLAPDFTGTIHVLGKGESVPQKISNPCLTAQDTVECWEQKVNDSLKKGNVDGALDVIVTLYEKNPNSGGSCHALTHLVGKRAFDLFEKKKNFDLSPKTAICAYGFYHGFMEELVSKTGDLKQAREFCLFVDKKLSAITSDAKLQCYHGIGHGVATIHEPVKKQSVDSFINPALDLCEKVSTDEDELYRCISGVYNALALEYNSGKNNVPFDKNDPMQICRKQKEHYKDACYGNMNTVLGSLNPVNPKASFEFIEQIKEDLYATSSAKYLMALYAPQYVEKKGEAILLCRSLQKRLINNCLLGMEHGLIEGGKPNVEYIEALNFCESNLLSSQERKDCIREAFGYFSSIYPQDKILQICKMVQNPDVSWCQK